MDPKTLCIQEKEVDWSCSYLTYFTIKNREQENIHLLKFYFHQIMNHSQMLTVQFILSIFQINTKKNFLFLLRNVKSFDFSKLMKILFSL